ncbi:hypothetical protein Daus18300_011752 [Diaporthe australafricana]|uniref:Uncharacterized protein n=1 Tax=Diaporthe australafricana TaxID=127596 RepID=A0ABR3W5K7_9PEZI
MALAARLSSEYRPFISLFDDESTSEAPRFALEIRGSSKWPNANELCITLPYRLEVNITRLPDAYKYSTVVFRWSLWNCLAKEQFILLHEKAPGQLEKVDVGMYDNVCPEEENEKAAGLDYNAENVWKMSPSPPRNTASCSLTLPANYQTKLIAGERYHLLWPGGRINLWDWDTEQQHVNLSTNLGAGEKPPIALLPAVGIVFKAVETDKPFYHRENIVDPEAPYRSFEKANAIELLSVKQPALLPELGGDSAWREQLHNTILGISPNS